jgi:pilus assembly protein CpaE
MKLNPGPSIIDLPDAPALMQFFAVQQRCIAQKLLCISNDPGPDAPFFKLRLNDPNACGHIRVDGGGRPAMDILLVSDCQPTASRVRLALAHGGYDCPLNNVVSVDGAISAAATIHPKPELVLFVLPRDTDRSRFVLRWLRDSLDAHILAIGPSDPLLSLGAVHAGAHDYLDGDLKSGLSSVVSRILAQPQKTSALGQLTTIISASGGSGQTLVATNLAVAIGRACGQCGLFDLDLRGSDVATYLGLKPRHTIADLCRDNVNLDQPTWEQSLLEHDTSVRVLPGPQTWDEGRHVTAAGVQKILRYGRTAFSHIVLDLSDFWLDDNAPILQESTTILLLFRLGFPAIRNAHRALQLLINLRVDPAKVHLTATRYGEHHTITPAEAEAVLNMKIRHHIPDESELVNACIDCGVPVITEVPHSSFAIAIDSIAQSLVGKTATLRPPTAQSTESASSPTLLSHIRSFLRINSREAAPRPR